MSGASGRGGRNGRMEAAITQYTGRQLLTRQPQTLATKVPLDAVVISELKLEMPVFHAVELASLCERFGKTPFAKRPTVEMQCFDFIEEQEDGVVDVILTDERKTVAPRYKQRTSPVRIEALGDLLKKITGQGIIRTLYVSVDDWLLTALHQAQQGLAPSRLHLLKGNGDGHTDDLLALVQHLAATGKVRIATFSFEPEPAIGGGNEINWQLLEDCLTPFSSLQRLSLQMPTSEPPPLSDWLKNAITANSQLKWLEIDSCLFFSPVVGDAIANIGRISDIRIGNWCGRSWGELLVEHVEADLAPANDGGRGPCTLTKLLLAMPETGHLKWKIDCPFNDYDPDYDGEYDDEDDVANFFGNMLRLGYYLLSLHKMGKAVAVKLISKISAVRMQQLVEDLAHFYHPLMETKDGAGGPYSYVYRVRVGSVKIDFYIV